MKELFGANWKANPRTIDDATSLLDSYIDEGLGDIGDKEILVIAPYIMLSDLHKYIKSKGYRFKLGAQNVSEHECGAFSGQISTNMLASVGVTEFLVGHSERREGYEEKVLHSQEIIVKDLHGRGLDLHPELIQRYNALAKDYTNEMLNRKITAIILHNKEYWEKSPNPSSHLSSPLRVVYCVGETSDEKSKGKTLDVIERQINIGLKNINKTDLAYVIIAYEPRWAIGTGKTANNEDIRTAHTMIRDLTREDITILYGGSMKPNNATNIMGIESVNGGLIGSASLNAQDFSRIVKYSQGHK